MKTSIQLDKENEKIFLQLASLYEYERRSKKAKKVLERLVAIASWNLEAWIRLVAYYRYDMEPEKESQAISKVIMLHKKQTEKLLIDFSSDPVATILQEELFDWGVDVSLGIKNHFVMAILSNLYLLNAEYQSQMIVETSDLIKKDDSDSIVTLKSRVPDENLFSFPAQKKRVKVDESAQNNTITRLLELYLISDQQARAERIASRLDLEKKSKFKYRLHLTDIMCWSGLHKESIKYLFALNSKFPRYRKILESAAKIASQTGDQEQAILAYEKLLVVAPGRRSYMRRLASIYLAENQPQKAYPLYKQLVLNRKKTKSRSQKKLIFKMLDSASYSGEMSFVFESLTIAEEVMPQDPQVAKRLADYYLYAEKPDKSYPYFKIYLASQKNPGQAQVLRLIDIANYSGNEKITIDALETAEKILPQDPAVQKRLAQIYAWLQNPLKSYHMHKQFIMHKGAKGKYIKQLIDTAAATNQQQLVEEALAIASRKLPGDAGIHLKRAEYLLGQKQEKKAAISYERYLGLKPDDIEVKKQLAQLYIWLNRQEKAYRLYKELFEQAPQDTFFQTSVLQMAGWLNRHQEVRHYLQRIAKLNPHNFEITLAAGDALIETGNTRAALPFFEQALKTRPQDMELRKKLALYYSWLNMHFKQIAQLKYLHSRKALPQEGYISLAWHYLDRKEWKKVLRLMKPFTSKRPLPRQPGIMLAIAYDMMGRKSQGYEIYQHLQKENSQDISFLSRLGQQAHWNNRPDIALQLFEKVLKAEPKNQYALLGSGQIYQGKRNFKKALQRLELYCQVVPKDYKIRYQLGQLFFDLGRKEKGKREFNESLRLMELKKGKKGKKL